MLNISRGQTRTTITTVQVPLRWSTEDDSFVLDTEQFDLQPTDELSVSGSDIQLHKLDERRVRLSVSATLTRRS